MSGVDAYGEFDLPEEKSSIEVVEDPFKTLVSSYHLYQAEAKKMLEGVRLGVTGHFQIQEKLYGVAEKIFDGKEKLSVKGSDLLRIVKEERTKVYFYFVNAKSHIGDMCDVLTGQFLSAVHNKTTLDVLIIKDIFCLFSAGYKLNKNKTLVIDRPATVFDLGERCEGNIVNYANLRHGFFQYLPYFSVQAKSGLQINRGKAVLFGSDSEGGVQINQGSVERFGEEGVSGIQINDRINHGADYYLSENKDIISLIKSEDNDYLDNQLDNKLSELIFLDKLMNEPVDVIEQKIRDFGWQRFEEDITQIANKIKERNDEKIKNYVHRAMLYLDYY